MDVPATETSVPSGTPVMFTIVVAGATGCSTAASGFAGGVTACCCGGGGAGGGGVGEPRIASTIATVAAAATTSPPSTYSGVRDFVAIGSGATPEGIVVASPAAAAA